MLHKHNLSKIAPIDQDNQHTIAVFGSLCAVVLSSVYFLSRQGLEIEFGSLFRLLGCSLLFLNFGSFFYHFFRQKLSKCTPLQITNVSGLLLFFGLSTISWFFMPSNFFDVLAGVGYLLFISNLWQWVKKSSLSSNALLSLTWSVFAIWLATRVWSNGARTPLFWENVITGAAHPDALFQIALTNMLSTYHRVSTGIDGLVTIQYHVGSHVLFTGLAKALQTSSLTFYQLGFPIIILPLFYTSVLNLGLYLNKFFRDQSKNSISLRHNWLFWIIFCVFQVSIFPTSLLDKLGMGDIYLYSESYTTATLITFLILPFLLPILQYLWKSTKIFSNQLKKIGLLIGMFGIFLFVGLTKISHLFLLVVIGWYEVIRTKYFTHLKILITLISLSVISFWLYKQVQLSDHTTHIFFLHYLLKVISRDVAIFWPIIGFLDIWLYTILKCLQLKVTTFSKFMVALHKNRLWDLEILIVLAVAGVFPSLLFDLGPNGSYFIDIHRWVALVFFLANINGIQTILNSIKKVYLILFLTFIFLALVIKVNSTITLFQTQNKVRRAAIISTYGNLNLRQATKNKDLAEFFLLLQSVDQHSFTRDTAIFVPRTSVFWSSPNECTSKPLIIPASTTLSIIDGLPNQQCTYSEFGYSAYHKTGHVFENASDVLSLCQYAKQKEFSKLLILDSNKSEMIDCVVIQK